MSQAAASSLPEHPVASTSPTAWSASSSDCHPQILLIDKRLAQHRSHLSQQCVAKRICSIGAALQPLAHLILALNLDGATAGQLPPWCDQFPYQLIIRDNCNWVGICWV